MIQQVRASEVNPSSDLYVNRPGRYAYRFAIHQVTETARGLLRIEYGATHVVAQPDNSVLVDRPTEDVAEVDLT